MFDVASIERTRENARRALLDARHELGHWEGELSSSALSTATAALALGLHARAAGSEVERRLAARGLAWLARHQNADGGWGDTSASPSNVSTTALAWTALGLEPASREEHAECLRRAEACLERFVGSLEPVALSRALLAAYGDDRTFSVPILVGCALGGRLGPEPAAWSAIPSIPFELAAFPQRFYRFLGLPMVSYALPALIAIGQVLHAKQPTRNPVLRAARVATRASTLRTLERIQPSSGGFLEATPLTSFVIASLIACGHERSPVVQEGLRFLRDSARADGSWPIDTNLATWLTSLAVDALSAGGRLEEGWSAGERESVARWLIGLQPGAPHLYTGAAAGGWAWTDRPGGVPDADDTAGALVALAHLARPHEWRGRERGLAWLLGVQNRDGGIPTFCRGWSGLPFDRSCADITAHALRAFAAWEGRTRASLARRIARARERAERYLLAAQRADGAWEPLWFGNQHVERLANPLYGTARVLEARATLGLRATAPLERAESWLFAAQNDDGGFGGARGAPSTLEETGLALSALCGAGPRAATARSRATGWIVRQSEEGRRFEPAPIGLYFARLWYSERLYPLIFCVAALERVHALERRQNSVTHYG